MRGVDRVVLNMADIARTRAAEANVSIEEYFAEMLFPQLAGDAAAFLLAARALAVIAARDDRAGGGPIRAIYQERS